MDTFLSSEGNCTVLKGVLTLHHQWQLDLLVCSFSVWEMCYLATPHLSCISSLLLLQQITTEVKGSEVQHLFHWAKIKVLARLHSFLKAHRENPFSYLFQLLETTLIPWLVGSLPSSKPVMCSPVVLLDLFFSLSLASLWAPLQPLSLPSLRTLVITLSPPG